MPRSPLLASCALICPAVTANVAGSLALQAALDGSAGLLFNVIGTGSSICVNGEVVIVEVVHDASSCEAGRSVDRNEGKLPQVPNGI